VETSELFGIPSPQALKVAAAIELIHAYSLVHDDLPCMDNADLRRNKPSCHKAFGQATAILVGDALIPLAFQTLSSLQITPEVRLELIEGLGHCIGSQGLVGGQMMDLGLEGLRVSYEDLLEQQRLKTGVLFSFSAETGAILGQGSHDQREALKAYGLYFGEAFQMIDDWLDGNGKEDSIGKPCGQDREKVTFLSLLGSKSLYEQAESATRKAIHSLAPFEPRAPFLREAALHTLSQIQKSLVFSFK
jgi:farnesyl diphosphate synthase